MTVRQVGIIGAGQMGSGIAQVCASAGYDVVLLDVSEEQLKKALDGIERGLNRLVQKGKVNDTTTVLARIRTTSAYADLSDADLVVEAATEKEAVKRAIYDELKPHLKDSAIVATNTSSISITRLGAASGRAERFIG